MIAKKNYQIHHGLLDDVPHHPSPHCDERPLGEKISLIIIHGISLPPREFGGEFIDQLFLGNLDPAAHSSFEALIGLKVSAHLLIKRDGEMIQYVPFHRRAWHAGQSLFREKASCNDFSIGIELEGADDIPYTTPQYHTLANVTRSLINYYPDILLENIVGHSDVAPVRKTDPGPAFDWDYYFSLVKEVSL